MTQHIDELTLSGVNDNKGGTTLTVLVRDERGDILIAKGSSVPPNSASGFAVGCQFIKADAATGQCVQWLNHGTRTSSAFRPHGPVIGYGLFTGGGAVASAGGDETEVLTVPGVMADDISFVEHQTSNDTDIIAGQTAGAGTITITASADPSTAHAYNYAVLREGCEPEYDIFAAGTHTTVGGAAAEAITLTGALATDIALVTYGATNDTDTIAKAVMTADTLTVTMSADPSTAHTLHYVILRRRGTFKPSHYIYAAGEATTVGGDAVETVSIASALATDVPIVQLETTNDTDTILKAAMTAGTLTVTLSADPSTAHALAYMILRAY